MEKEIAHTAEGPILVPDTKITVMAPGYTTVALRGYGYVVAVMFRGICVGWAVKSNPII